MTNPGNTQVKHRFGGISLIFVVSFDLNNLSLIAFYPPCPLPKVTLRRFLMKSRAPAEATAEEEGPEQPRRVEAEQLVATEEEKVKFSKVNWVWCTICSGGSICKSGRRHRRHKTRNYVVEEQGERTARLLGGSFATTSFRSRTRLLFSFPFCNTLPTSFINDNPGDTRVSICIVWLGRRTDAFRP